VIYTRNAIDSINARIREAVKARGHFPTEQAALMCEYLAVMRVRSGAHLLAPDSSMVAKQ
jgi:transposase-like protein